MHQSHSAALILAASLVLAACGRAPVDRVVDDERVGLLHHAEKGNCPSEQYCGPSFSLLNESLDQWTPLEGNIEPAHHHLVVAVDGRQTRIDERDKAWFGTAAASHAIDVKRYRLLSEIPYHPFLVEQASVFTTRKYGCDLLWDKSFRWEVIDGRVHYVVRMTDTFSTAQARPYLELTYDGNTGHFLAEDMSPWGMNPCDS